MGFHIESINKWQKEIYVVPKELEMLRFWWQKGVLKILQGQTCSTSKMQYSLITTSKNHMILYIYIILCKYLLKNPVLYYFHEAVYSLNVLCFSIFGGDRCQKILILLYHRSGKEPPKRIYFR